MGQLQDSAAELERAYLAELRQEHMGPRVRMAAAVIGIINVAFIGLDAYAYPDHFADFVWVRLALTGLLAFGALRLARTHPAAGQATICASTAAMLLYVIYATAAPTSDYYVGLVLFIMGTPVLLPLRPREAAAFSVPATLAFMLSPLALGGVGGEAASGVWQEFAIHSCFLAGATLVGVSSAYALDRHRFNDFHQRRILERARDDLRELDRAKSRFSANVHHELRTPLTLILSPLEAMMAEEFGPIEAAQRPHLESMVANARRLLRLINDLLDVSKIESEQLRLHRRPLRIGRVVEDLVTGARPLARRKNVRIEMRGLDVLPEINADLDAVEKVFMNLLGNSLKFTERGGRIEITGVAEGDGICVTVADDGVGIPVDQLDRVFDRFAQVDGSSTRRHEGTGIGLSLAKELVELHGGRIWARSEGLGQGARFGVVLPRGHVDAEDNTDAAPSTRADGLQGLLAATGPGMADPEAEGEAPAATPHAAEEAPTVPTDADRTRAGASSSGRPNASGGTAKRPALAGRPKLIVAEDNADMRRFLAAILGVEYSVRTASNGREALERAREARPDLIVTDVMMPEMSGTDLCRALDGDPKTRGTPVLLLTARADREMRVAGLELGARDYLTKPFHPSELLARVRSIVQLELLQRKLAQRNAVLESTIYELKQTEVQLVQAERLAAVGELAAGIAHEVNNPVNFSINSLQALRARFGDIDALMSAVGELDPESPERLRADLEKLIRLEAQLGFADLMPELLELVEIATDGLDRTHRLVKDLQNFARPGNVQHGPVDVRDALASTIRLVRAAALDADVSIESALDEEVPMVEGSVSVLNQVFLNLLKNATEALEDRRGGTVRVSVHCESDREGDEVVVRVADDGPGVDPGVASQVFDPFVSTKPAGRGAGLGLSMCRRILNELGGSIELVDRELPGATFEVRLPACERDAEA
jgi:signal transduction histidine kinase